jgi:hypothetical protein
MDSAGIVDRGIFSAFTIPFAVTHPPYPLIEVLALLTRLKEGQYGRIGHMAHFCAG